MEHKQESLLVLSRIVFVNYIQPKDSGLWNNTMTSIHSSKKSKFLGKCKHENILLINSTQKWWFTSLYCCFILVFTAKYFALSLTQKKYLQSDWQRGVQYWPYLYSVFNICTLWLSKKKNTTFGFGNGRIEMYSLKIN